MIRWAGLLLCAVAVGFVLGSHIAQRPEPHVQEARATPRDHVTDADVELYIAVYSAMQADHGLTIDEALAGHGMDIEQFRDLERRVQADQRTVDRVRLALLNRAKSRNTWMPPGSAAAPAATPETKR
jgi:hypothetical protein